MALTRCVASEKYSLKEWEYFVKLRPPTPTMQHFFLSFLFGFSVLLSVGGCGKPKDRGAGDPSLRLQPQVQSSANGIAFPADVEQWRLLSVSYRTDKHSPRAILGNSIAIEAAGAGQTNPWPKGASLAKLVWKEKVAQGWDAALVPGGFVHLELMVKDADRFSETGGWGYARWVGEGREPHSRDPKADRSCLGCHTIAKGNDFVFTEPYTKR